MVDVADPVVAVGFDPGWAKTGIAAVRLFSDGRAECIGAAVVSTQKEHAKRFERLRVSADDERRLREQHAAFCSVVEQVRPHVIGVEVYTIFESREYERLRDAGAALLSALGVKPGEKVTGSAVQDADAASRLLPALDDVSRAVDGFRLQRGRGDAAKTYGVYATVQAVAARYGVPCYGFMPVDLKNAVCGTKRTGRTKDDVGAGVRRLVAGVDAQLDLAKVAPSLRNHADDAVGHALLALRAYVAWAQPWRTA